MGLKIALIALLSVATSSALSLEGFKCRDHNVMTGDPVTPIRTVRICGVQDYAAPPSYLDFQKIMEIEQKARDNYATNSYGNNGFWRNRGLLRSPRPSYARWPLAPQQTNNESEELLSTLIKSLAVAPATYGAARNNPTNSRDLMEAERLLQEKLRSITEDTSEIKSSVNKVNTNIKNILDTLLMQNANQQKDMNVNINLKLDPAFEALLRDFMALFKNEVISEGNEESTSTARIQGSSDESSDDYASFFSTAYTNENMSSEEQVTEAQVDSAELSTERDATEEIEDINSWLRLHFGPIVKTPTYDEDTDNSEQENETEKPEESFESWFNANYRRLHTTEAPTDYSSLDEQTYNSQGSQEHVQKGSEENNNRYIDIYSDNELDDIIKSSEENTVSEETTESSEEADNNNYDAVFVPTTMNSLESSEIVEQLENGDTYNYATATDEQMKTQQKTLCVMMAFQSSSNDLDLLRENLDKCSTEHQKFIVIGDATDANESKSSEETETPLNDSNESKSSEETETPIGVSNESKSSEETGNFVTESNESKSSEETETPIGVSNESKSSEERVNFVTESNESKSSEETETPIVDWYMYDDDYNTID
ncbi:nestin-like [Bactrocera tryoni]|uniref:nestin-like n=1 Tax=Bactrocera tryoni TaxID=59916 RepID=UPI001A959868|nr:nestin-like [Bactrocera tryoni]